MVSLRSLLGRRIVRILDPSRSLSTRAGTRAVLATLAAGFAGTLLAGLLGVGEGKREALAQTEEKAKSVATKPASEDGKIRGQVVGPDGKPVAGRSRDGYPDTLGSALDEFPGERNPGPRPGGRWP